MYSAAGACKAASRAAPTVALLHKGGAQPCCAADELILGMLGARLDLHESDLLMLDGAGQHFLLEEEGGGVLWARRCARRD